MRKDILIYFTGKIFPAIINLLIIVFAVRLLGSKEYGKFTIIYSFVMLIHTLTYGWVQQSLLRYYSKYDLFKRIAENRFGILIFISSLFGVCIILLTGLFYFSFSLLDLLLTSLYLIMFNYFMFRLCLSQVNFKPIQYVIRETKFYVIYGMAMGFFIFVLKYSGYPLLFISMLISLLYICIEDIIWYLRDSSRKIISKRFLNKAFTNQAFQYGFSLTIWLFISYILNVSDRYVIKYFCSYQDVGTYSAIYDILFKISTFACTPILLVFHPKIVKHWNEKDYAMAFTLIKKALFYELLIFIGTLILYIPMQEILYHNLLHLQSIHLWIIALPILLSAFLWQSAMLIHKPLELLFTQKFMILAILICLSSNIMLNIILVPRYGYKIAAFTTLISIIIYLLLTGSRSLKIYKSMKIVNQDISNS